MMMTPTEAQLGGGERETLFSISSPLLSQGVRHHICIKCRHVHESDHSSAVIGSFHFAVAAFHRFRCRRRRSRSGPRKGGGETDLKEDLKKKNCSTLDHANRSQSQSVSQARASYAYYVDELMAKVSRLRWKLDLTRALKLRRLKIRAKNNRQPSK